jgi:hypothetical protein
MQYMTNAAVKLAPPSKPNARPPGWGNDGLSKFIEAAHQNQYATFFKKRDATGKLIAIDDQLAKVSENWLNPPSEILAMLFVRCHGAFRTAASLAMSGQAAESYVQCRAMLEYAAYAVHIHADPSRGVVWLDRHQSPAQMEAQKNAFSHRNVAASVAKARGLLRPDDELGAATGAVDEVVDKICDVRAETMFGLCIKARAACWTFKQGHSFDPFDATPDSDLVDSVFADLIRIADRRFPRDRDAE